MKQAKDVTIVFTDRKKKRYTADSARSLCCDPAVNGRIIDALTADETLQNELREDLEKYVEEGKDIKWKT